MIARTEFLLAVFDVVTAFNDYVGLVYNHIRILIQMLSYKSAFQDVLKGLELRIYQSIRKCLDLISEQILIGAYVDRLNMSIV